MKNFMEQNLETVDKHKMTIDELLFLQNLQEDLQKAEITCNGNDAIATYYVLKEQVRKYIDPFFGNIEHQPNGFEFRIQGSDNDRIIDNFNELYEYLKQEIQNSELKYPRYETLCCSTTTAPTIEANPCLSSVCRWLLHQRDGRARGGKSV